MDIFKGTDEPAPAPRQNLAKRMEDITEQLALQVSQQLPGILQRFFQGGMGPDHQPLQLECTLTAAGHPVSTAHNRVQVASVHIGRDFTPLSPVPIPQGNGFADGLTGSLSSIHHDSTVIESNFRPRPTADSSTPDDSNSRPVKRHRTFAGSRAANSASRGENDSDSIAVFRRLDSGSRNVPQLKKKTSDNPALQPSTAQKFVAGIWESIFSGTKMDPAQIIEQWQTIESSGQPKLLTESDQYLAVRSRAGAFSRMNALARKISQMSKTCRSLEVIVQAHWMQCFDDRVATLSAGEAREAGDKAAKKTAIAEACVDFNWSEKELRNKMGIWRGYQDIKRAAGWAALVFAGTGLYRFCKYRVSFTDETFETLKALRHRFEVAADTLHPRWRTLLDIIGESTEPKYTGHPHDWVVNGPGNEAIPLPKTYHQWDKNFSYTHLDDCVIDEDAWDDFDPRSVVAESDSAAYICQYCHKTQSDDPTQNTCDCHPNVFGTTKASMVPMQVFRTPDGKNNGLIACCPLEDKCAVGEFAGQVTSGINSLDCMVDETDRAVYQIWQGKQGNFTRFINHSCQPNTEYKHFVWLGKQRYVLLSKGIEAGQEITVDYGETYWQVGNVVIPLSTTLADPNCRI